MRHSILILAPLLAAPVPRVAADPPWYDDRKDLLWYKDDAGKLQPVKTAKDWAKRVAHIREHGTGDGSAAREVEPAVEREDGRDDQAAALYAAARDVRRGRRRPPAGLAARSARARVKDRCPAMICLPGSSAPGKNTPAGLTATPMALRPRTRRAGRTSVS